MPKILSYTDIKKSFENKGYTLLSTAYVGWDKKLDYICPRGHVHSITWNSWKNGRECPYCKKRGPVTFKEVNKSFEDAGYVLLSDSYINARTKLYYTCPNGTNGSIIWDSWRRGNRCACCSGKKKKTIGFIKKEFEKYYYKVIDTEYINAFTKINYICDEGHKHSTSWAGWSRGVRCGKCNGSVKYTIDEIKNICSKRGYKLLSTEYNSNKDNVLIECPHGHKYNVTWSNFNRKYYECPQCNNTGTSYQEKELIDFVSGLSCDYIEHDRSLIGPKEVDINIQSKQIAIEYCGLYWHSELADKDRKYHLNKLNLCNEKDYKLLTVFEDEWVNKKQIVESVLKNKLGVQDGTKIYARKCEVKEISAPAARKFCEQNHLQGYTGSSIKLGLFHQNTLVSVMTFSKQSIAKGAKHKDKYWELSRFCNKINYSVVGGASKLLKYFERNYSWEKITSYADRRWSDGNMYYKLGFDFDSITQPNYWYFKGQKRIHRFALRKKPDEPKDRTEWELRQGQGYNRIWDCGNLKFVKHSN